MQLVLSNNRVIAYDESNSLIAMGGTVVNTANGNVYQNATIAKCDCLPTDINDVGYEYRNGNFVPCAPFGEGDGNVALYCGNTCKVPRDSGVEFSQIVQRVSFEYTGDGGRSVSIPTEKLPPNFVADMLHVFGGLDYAIITPYIGTTFAYHLDENNEFYKCDRYIINEVKIGASSIFWRVHDSTDRKLAMNEEGVKYKVVAFGHREVQSSV